jgi:hypothetical protein
MPYLNELKLANAIVLQNVQGKCLFEFIYVKRTNTTTRASTQLDFRLINLNSSIGFDNLGEKKTVGKLPC